MEDVDTPFTEDEVLPEFDILHALTGALNLTYTYDGNMKIVYLIKRQYW